MTQANNHEHLINGARDFHEVERALKIAENDSISTTYKADECNEPCEMEFADGSKLYRRK